MVMKSKQGVQIDFAWPLAMRMASLWLVFVAWSSCSGWILSYIGALNGFGYAAAAVPLLAIMLAVWKSTSGAQSSLRLRFKPAATAWLLVMLLCLMAGLLHPPSNYDALSYRLPRILYWWQEGHWHWLQSADPRMNYSGTGFEWQMLPWLILFRSDQFLFLLNWLPALLLPALNFHALRFLGCRTRAAALWMWPLSLS
jgi:hypothetical protein